MKTEKKRMYWDVSRICCWIALLFFAAGCDAKDDAADTPVPDNWIQNLPEEVTFNVQGGEREVTFNVAEGVDLSHIGCIMEEANRKWCDVTLDEGTMSIKVPPSSYYRSAVLTLVYDESHRQTLTVKQDADFSAYFQDETCAELREGLTDEEIAAIPSDQIRELALAMKAGNYDPEFRAAVYRPYQDPTIMADANKTSRYSQCDNPTGIFAEKDETLYIWVGKLYEGANLQLMFLGLDGGYGNQGKLTLVQGLNKVVAPITGEIYVQNFVTDDIPLVLDTDEARQQAAAKSVAIHFLFGKVNGYFDIQKHTKADWDRILDIAINSGYGYIDLLGKRAQITWEAKQFKDNESRAGRTITGTDVTDDGNTDKDEIWKIIETYDNLVYWEQEFAGLVKYNRMFNNRLHFCIDNTASSPNASNYRTVYPAKITSPYNGEMFFEPNAFKARLWGPAHEAGHVNQVRPGAKWAGMTEVTNNIYCLYAQEKVGANCKLQVDKINPKDENGVSQGSDIIYNAATKLIVDGERAHCLPGISSITRETQLVPFWQLYLYIVKARGQEDFYKDLYEYFRENESPSEKGQNAGLDQLDFVRQACRISNLNLIDFFTKWGFLRPCNATLNDYGNKDFVVSQADIDVLVKEIESAGYDEPAADIYKITDNTWQSYK